MLDRLTDAGYKITEPRRRVLDALSNAHGPLTAQEVAAHASASVASTYRALTLLVELGIVSELEDPAEREGSSSGESRGKRYALCATQEHHHHFTCRGCHATLEMTCDALERALTELEGATGVVIEHHDVNLRGLCGACQNQLEAAQ